MVENQDWKDPPDIAVDPNVTPIYGVNSPLKDHMEQVDL